MHDRLERPTPPAYDRTERPGNIGLVLALAIGLVGAIVFASLLPAPLAPKFAAGLLALLAVAGVFSAFAYAVGFLRLPAAAARRDVARQIADTFSEGLLVTEGDSQIVYANDAYMELCSARDAAGLVTVERLFSGPADVSEAIYRLAQAARARRYHAEDIRLAPPLTGDAEVGWYRIRVRPLKRDGGGVSNLWTVVDATADRQRQENFFQELQHAIDFLDHAPAGFFSAAPDGAISYMNKTLAGWLGYDLTQVGSGGVALSDIVANSGSTLITSVAGGAGEVRTAQIDLDLKRRNGRTLPVRLLHRVAFGQDGTPGASRTLVLNRAAGEEPEEDLRAAEVRFARFFNSTPMAIAAVDQDGRVTRSNAAFAKLLPLAMKGAVSWPILDGVVERDRPALREAVAAALDNKGDVEPVDAALEDSEGRPMRSARFFAAPAEDAGGKGAMIYALDTTEQRKLQEGFAQSQKMQAVGQLAGGVAHDFNNMLTAIIGYSDLLLANHRPTDPSFQDIIQIKQTANRAAGLTRQLLAFSRRQTLRPQVLQLGDVLSELQLLLRRLVGEKVEVDLKHGRDLWFVKADINQLEQVVINLVVNARDAMPESGGRITLRTRNIAAADCASFGEASLAATEYVLIEVEDNGSGIPADVKAKIFEPFFTTKEVGKGTGLGLAMVFGIVKQSGGFVFVDSEVGRGTVFRILLPRHVPEAGELPSKVEAPKAATDYTGQGSILLVEDEDAVRAFAARALVSRGYSVLEASSGLEALEVVEREGTRIDLIVSDVVMPEMDGPAMFAELRKRGVTAKVVFVSGYAEEAFAKNLPEGDFGFLPKPFSLKQLIETVKASLG
ncbi:MULTISPECIES: cell cycle histidine kinase CckA [Methylosinus]|uniref:histidine kinase n=1 Tax=Methylosinus trichosporium (strain ATCC 35070 / NCIMB 11131 / UNIQEM 75 / OB3b) TaxID=595536 RepID=A0A2D2CVP0_METT3|nr:MULTISPECIES: ATP-binding protein [Methylosinus]ATQ66709.1 PAS domain-containing sensor histidine kinase [Methylosinus trichosporium OB3b]OBS53378.1 hybrid sensor histidine kinase/response regulator [Methylosinus sp. 3S-1]